MAIKPKISSKAICWKKTSCWTAFCLTTFLALASGVTLLAQTAQTQAPDQPASAMPNQPANPPAPANPAPPTTVNPGPPVAHPVGPTPRPEPTPPPDDITRRDLSTMDRFLDDHREIAEQLRHDPSLIDNQKWVAAHPELQQFLQNNPQVAAAFKADPNLFMHDAESYNRRDDISRPDVVELNRFLDDHREIAEQLRHDPKLIDNQQWVAAHPQLQEFLENHQQLAAAFRANPNEFMRDEYRYDQTGKPYGQGNDRNGEMASFGQFLGVHSNVAAELRADPSLATNKEYLATHPELDGYLKAHPTVNDELAQNPQGVMSSDFVQKSSFGAKPVGPTAAPPTAKPNQ
jgi:hypothetical protein